MVRHEVPRTKIEEAGLVKGERYKASLSNVCLGTRWWMFGGLDEVEGVRFWQWSEAVDGYDEREGGDEHGKWILGERPDDLELVPEVGEVVFEIF